MIGVPLWVIILAIILIIPIFEMRQGIPEYGLRTYLEYLAGVIVIGILPILLGIIIFICTGI